MELKSEVDDKFFWILEKYRAIYHTIRKVIHDAQKITDNKKLNDRIFFFLYEIHWRETAKWQYKALRLFKDIPIHHWQRNKKKWEGKLTGKKIHQSLIIMEINKSPGNDGLTKEFYCTFWNEIKNISIHCL